MELNADLGQRAIMHAETLPWVSSPIAGIERRMLDRIGGEVVRATTIVRYARDISWRCAPRAMQRCPRRGCCCRPSRSISAPAAFRRLKPTG
jgi:hypothetical protein